ncbi:MAG: 3-phosphoshikimate 1-carboxyvinyltransferase [Planctomycetota bacterium]|nr:MAG: 3-phosphoshikimate 1-carboxyvinyltransferase [Planctomycetota bacterium]
MSTSSANDRAGVLSDPFPVPRAVGPIRTSIRVPGSKSITNRALILAALADGVSVLHGALRSDDTDGLVSALQVLGCVITVADDSIRVHGCGGRFAVNAPVHINLGDGGTPTRFMMAAASLARAPVTIDGSARMRQRPVADGVTLLESLGVGVTSASAGLPLTVTPGSAAPHGGVLRVSRTATSQCVSGLLLCAPWFRDGLRVEFTEQPTSQSYLELTIDELRRWGVAVEESRNASGSLTAISVPHGPPRARADVHIEADASSAIYWAAAAAIIPGSVVELLGLPQQSRQPDMRAIETIGSMGAIIVPSPIDRESTRVACATIDDQPPLRGGRFDMSSAPDGAVAIAAIAAVADRETRLDGLSTLRVKESDRLAALRDGLIAIGAGARIDGDSLVITPIRSPAVHSLRAQALIQTVRDHRVAMAFSVIGLRTGGVQIVDPGCVAKSYPAFWTNLARIVAGH